MAVHNLTADTSTMRWSPYVLDRMVAPECSALTACNAPDVPELVNYFGSFFLNSIFVAPGPDKARPLILVFVRRLAQAIREYRSARDYLSQYVAALPQTNNVTGLYLQALSHFEQTVVNAYLALLAHYAIGKTIDPSAGKPFNPGDGAPAQRLNSLSNALKHFAERMEAGQLGDVAAPVWIVNDGLRCKEPGVDKTTTLGFEELVALLSELERDAKFLTEDVYRIASERRRSGPSS